MKVFFTRAACVFFLSAVLFAATRNARAADDGIPPLIEKLKKVASPEMGMNKEEQKIAEQLQRKGAPAIPYLLPLLKDDNQAIRTLASYTLRDIDGLTEKDLDALIDSCRHGDGWIPPAIAKIGTPKAVDFLVEELVRERRDMNQVTYAIEILGEKAVPDLVEVYRKDQNWDFYLRNTMYSVFKSLGPKAAGAVDPLMKIAADPSVPEETRKAAIFTIAAIGPTAEKAVPALQVFYKSDDPALKDEARFAIVSIGTPDAVPVLFEQLDKAGDTDGREDTIRAIAELREHGNSAGPGLMKYLASDDWELRVAAARTMGFIGYKESADALIPLLDRKDDWRVVWCAAMSLAKLREQKALPGLERVAKEHWYSPVREAARAAVKEIRDGVPAEKKDQSFYEEFTAYQYAGRKIDTLRKNAVVDESKLVKDRLSDTEVSGPVNIKLRDGTMRNYTGRGVKVEEGFLLGFDEGEFGGGLGVYDAKGDELQAFDVGNTQAVFKTANAIFVVTGLTHMIFNEGRIYKITKGEDGKWKAEPWRQLPGGPEFGMMLKNGSIVAGCYGGTVRVSPDGEMALLTRKEALGK